MLNIESNQNIKQLLRHFRGEKRGDNYIDKARVMAVNKVVAKTKTTLSREARLRYNVKAKRVQSSLRVRRASKNDSDAMLDYVGARIGLINFAAKSKNITLARRTRKGKRLKRKAVTVKILKAGSRKQVKSKPAFIAEIQGHKHVLARKNADRDSLRVLNTLSVPEMMSISTEEGEAIKQIPIEFEKQFEQALSYLASQKT